MGLHPRFRLAFASSLTKRLAKHRLGTAPGQDGFSFVVVLFVVLALLLGSLALAGRSFFGVLGSAFQVQSREATSAAELGATYAMATLNQVRNRPMLVTTATGNEATFAAPQTRWAAVADSPCAPTAGSPPVVQTAQNTSLDPNPGTAAYEEWYVPNGTTVTSTQPAGGNYRSFKIVGVRRPSQNGNSSTGDPATSGGLRVYRDRDYANLPSSGTQPFYLRVQGSSFRNGVRVATTTLEQEYEVVPKCCGRTFGGSHGNDVYNLSNKLDGEVATCVPTSGLGYGLLAGAGPGSGQVTLNGTPNVESGTGVPIDPIFCLIDTVAANPSTCTYKVGNNTPQVSLVDYNLGLPKTFTQATGATATPLPLAQCSSATSCPSNSATTQATPTDTTFTKRATANICANGASTCNATNPVVISSGDTIVNVSSVSEANLPTNCRKTPTGTVASGTVETIHCNITDLKPSGNNNIVFRTTPNRRISLYFPNANTGNGANASIIDVGGNNAIDNLSCNPTNPANCSKPTLTQDPPYPVTTLSIFGCVTAGCGPQTVKLNGTPENLFTFIWLPYGTMDYRGTSDLAGVVWTENLSMSGTPTFTVPGSGIGDVLCLIGAVACNTNPTPTTNPFLFDWVARATNRFRFIGQ